MSQSIIICSLENYYKFVQKILGVTNSEPSSSCLFINGKIVSACSEEAFTRIKNDDSFPYNSIDWILKKNNIKNVKDIDHIAYAWSKGLEPNLLESLLKRYNYEIKKNDKNKSIFLERLHVETIKDLEKQKEFKDWIKKNNLEDKVIFLYHHEAHALSSILVSGLTKGICITADARGDYESLVIWQFDLKKKEYLRKLLSIPTNDSLGFFYGRITGLLGFTPNRHEGKITGLAAYGRASKTIKLMNKMIHYKNGTVRANNGSYYRPFFSNYSKEIINEIKKYKPEDVAAGAQKHLENVIMKLLKKTTKNIKKYNLCLAGGVFANVRLNQKLKELKSVNKVFIQPQMNDGGLCVGAAAAVAFNNKNKILPMVSAKLGYQNDQSVIKFLIKKYKLKKITQDPIKFIIESLKNNLVLGVVRGAMEFGPRALLNRSIVYKTSDVTCNNWLNKRLSRTDFMPFAPFTIPSLAKKSFYNFDNKDKTLHFMTSTIKCKKIFKNKSPAVYHVDGTARPQIIFKNQDPFFYELIEQWHKETGELSLINTSFNIHEQPIIRTYQEGIFQLNKGVIDILMLENNIYKKN